jgi:hypothetical protein
MAVDVCKVGFRSIRRVLSPKVRAGDDSFVNRYAPFGERPWNPALELDNLDSARLAGWRMTSDE